MPVLGSATEAQGAEVDDALARVLAGLGRGCRPAALARVTRTLQAALAVSPNPTRALAGLERMLSDTATAPAVELAGDRRLLEMVITVLGGSAFLGEALLRDPTQLVTLRDRASLTRLRDASEYRCGAWGAASAATGWTHQLDALRRWQRTQMLRIGACDLLGLLDLSAITHQLSCLADGLIQTALDLAVALLQASADRLAVLALGKLGGQELNYSSDVDLIFVAEHVSPTLATIAQRTVDALARITGEGFAYRVDLRLRPWGKAGPLVASLPGYLAYLASDAHLWEKQALLKARPVAGDLALGEELLCRAMPLLLAAGADAVRADVRAMKARIEAELRRRGREWGDVKLGWGSIRDVEFVVQYLQLRHGLASPEVLSRNTLEGLARLHASGLLSSDDYRTLAEGYTFLRPVEHYLQIVHYRQVHELPTEARALTALARRLGFGGTDPGGRFLQRYQEHAAAVRRVYQRQLEGEEMTAANGSLAQSSADVLGHVERMAPSYAATFTPDEIAHHARMADRLDQDNLVEVDALPLADGSWRVTLVGYDYAGELSLICGLLFAYGLNIRDGQVFTYELLPSPRIAGAAIRGGRSATRERRKIVDVFTVRPAAGTITAELWPAYKADLMALLRRLEAGERREAQGELARRAAAVLRETAGPLPSLYPIDIAIDNDASERYTVLHIAAPDTIGFLYEFTSALALQGLYIARVVVDSVGSRARDTFWLTDARGQKISSPQKQEELRAATALVKHFTHLLPQSPNPEAALLHFHEFLGELFRRPDWPAELDSLERPEVLNALARLLGVSEFLWDDFLRLQHANLFPVLRDVDSLTKPRTRAELAADLQAVLGAAPDGQAKRAALNAFKDREMFRIDLRHIEARVPGLGTFPEELTDLAEVVVAAALDLCLSELRVEQGDVPGRLAVCALGKCGGRELGYASDIELMFVFDVDEGTEAQQAGATALYYEEVIRRFSGTILSRRQGIFEIDLQLRPYGSAGSLAVSLESFRRYYAPGGPAWPYERQALVKLRPIAGDEALGAQVLALRDAFVYSGEPFDAAAMRAMRERQIRHRVIPGTINAKYSPGGSVDVEYLVQALQITHGADKPALRTSNTRAAVAALHHEGVLSAEDARRLDEAYAFLRQLIDALRMVRGNAKDLTVPPQGSDELAFLARRLRYEGDPERLGDDLARHLAAVQELLRRLLA
ncbi:MAG: glutamine synthetase adenylyltransferase [Anaerolineae bacterium]